MKKLSTIAAGALLMFLAVAQVHRAYAADTEADRRAAATRYLNVVPMSKLLDDSVSEMAKRLPPEKRAEFVKVMKQSMRADVLERLALEAMVKTFTTEELNALAEFYGSKNGRSAMAKFGVYMAEIMPPLQQELMRAAQEAMKK